MAKRAGSFDNNTCGAKKAKVDDEIDDLWGEDLNADDVDDCIMLATQVLEEQNFSCTQRNNVSILPSYNAFKQDQRYLFSSTQNLNNGPTIDLNISNINSSPIPKKMEFAKMNSFTTNTSYNSFKPPTNTNLASNLNPRPDSNVPNKSNLSKEIKKLQEQLLAKEGEISFLRNQLKETKTNIGAENVKMQLEWTEKLKGTIKEMNGYQTELEFKNLEISNLKVKIHELQKNKNFNFSFNGTSASSTIPPRENTSSRTSVSEFTSNHSKPKEDSKLTDVLVLIENTHYPLKDRISSKLFNTMNKSVEIDNFMFYNYIHSNTYRNIPILDKSQFVSPIYPKTYLEDKTELDLLYVINDISNLCKLSTADLSLEIAAVNKVITSCQQLLTNYYTYMETLEKFSRTENVRYQDTLYLEKKIKLDLPNMDIFDPQEWCENEIGIQGRQILAFVAELLPYSDYLQGYLFNSKPLWFKVGENYVRYFPAVQFDAQRKACVDGNFGFLKLLLSLARIFGRIRKADKCPGMLAAITLFITNVCSTPHFSAVSHYVGNIFKEIIFARPNNQVMCYVTQFLKEASLHEEFVKGMCKMTSMNGLKTISKQGIIYYNQDSCVFQVFSKIYEQNILINTKRYIGSHLNLMSFILNAFSSKSKWLHYQESNYCDCLSKINTLTVEILYESLEVYSNDVKFTSSANSQLDLGLININEGRLKTVSVNPENDSDIFCKLLHYGIKVLSLLNFKSYDLIEKSISTLSKYKLVIRSLLELKEVLKLNNFELECLDHLNVIEDVSDEENINFDIC